MKDRKNNTCVDSSGAVVVARGVSNCKLKHLNVETIWTQEKVKEEYLEIRKVARG